MEDGRIGEIYGMYSEMEVTFNAANSYIQNPLLVGIDGDGNGYYNLTHLSGSWGGEVYDTRITTGQKINVGWCLLPVNTLSPTTAEPIVTWQYTNWIKGDDWIIA